MKTITTYRLENLECAVCAKKMENAVSTIPGIYSANISFVTQKLTFESENDDISSIKKRINKEIRKIEPDCRIVD